MTSTHFDRFDRTDLTFKTIHEQPLQATVLIPKALKEKDTSQYPVLVYWHGGGFVVGHRMYEGWFPSWLLGHCTTTPAIIVSPDYRLLPESNSAEILSDVESFWTWMHQTLPNIASSWHAKPDLSRIACAGTSAGGYIAVQSALLFPDLSKIKLLITIAGSLNTDIPHYRTPGPKVILGKRAPPPADAERIVRTYVKAIKPHTIRTSGDPVEMWEFLTCVLQQAYLPRWMGLKTEERFDVMKVLDKVDNMPPIWVVQGNRDSVVPPICATGFVDKVQQVLPHIPIFLSLQPGDHGFETNHSIDDDWVQEGFSFVTKYWP